MAGFGAIGGLKFVVDQHVLAADAHTEEAVGAADVGLLGVEHFDVLDVVALEGEAGEVSRVGLDEMFGNSLRWRRKLDVVVF